MRKSLISVLAVLAVSSAAGCGSTSSGSPAAGARFPITLAAANGRVTIPRRPSRIVSLSPTATQDLYAVGAGPQVVAVDADSTYPAAAPHTTLSGLEPNVEAIAAYRPDLVVISNDIKGVAGELGKLGIPVLLEPAANQLQDVYAEIAQIGAATGHATQAAGEVATLRGQIDALVRSVPRPKRALTVYHELDQTYYSLTGSTFIGQIYRALGLRDIADAAPGGSDYPQLSNEYIISADPDLIVLADTVCCQQSLDTVRARPGWNTIKAVQSGAVVPVDDSVASQWGPRVVEFVRAIVAELKRLAATGA